MAGSRQRSGRPRRDKGRSAYWAQRISRAPDASAQLREAVNYIRATAAKQDDPAPLLNRAALQLARLADEASRRAAA